MNDTRFPVSVYDFITKDKFAAQWLIKKNLNTQMYFPTGIAYEVSDLILPGVSFLGRLVQSVWLGGTDPVSNKAVLFRQIGYPIQVDTSITGIDTESWFSLLKAPVNFALDPELNICNCRIQVEEVTPLKFAESIETWAEIHEKEKGNA